MHRGITHDARTKIEGQRFSAITEFGQGGTHGPILGIATSIALTSVDVSITSVEASVSMSVEVGEPSRVRYSQLSRLESMPAALRVHWVAGSWRVTVVLLAGSGCPVMCVEEGRLSRGRRQWLIPLVVVLLVVGGVGVWVLARQHATANPRCSVTALGSASGGDSVQFVLSPEQADNAATIAGIGIRLGMPDHAVTVALATALQESGLSNLNGGDRDSAGLFQQRPSQHWGTAEQVRDPVHATVAFYQRLRQQPDWQQISVTEAAQLVQHSATPWAYADWEPEARSLAAALTGETPGTMSCSDLTITAPSQSLVNTAATELGTSRLSGKHTANRGWAIATWLVTHSSRLGVDRVSFDGRTWTASTGTWTRTSSADGALTLHQVPPQEQ